MTDVGICENCGAHTAVQPSPAGPRVCETCMPLPKFQVAPQPPVAEPVVDDVPAMEPEPEPEADTSEPAAPSDLDEPTPAAPRPWGDPDEPPPGTPTNTVRGPF